MQLVDAFGDAELAHGLKGWDYGRCCVCFMQDNAKWCQINEVNGFKASLHEHGLEKLSPGNGTGGNFVFLFFVTAIFYLTLKASNTTLSMSDRSSSFAIFNFISLLRVALASLSFSWI